MNQPFAMAGKRVKPPLPLPSKACRATIYFDPEQLVVAYDSIGNNITASLDVTGTELNISANAGTFLANKTFVDRLSPDSGFACAFNLDFSGSVEDILSYWIDSMADDLIVLKLSYANFTRGTPVVWSDWLESLDLKIDVYP